MAQLCADSCILNLTCYLLATLGLFYHVYQVSVMFFGFQTRFDIEVETPMTISMPGVTVCIKLDPRPETLASLYSNRGMTLNEMRNEYIYLPINVLSTLETIDVHVDCYTKYPQLNIKEAPDGKPCHLFAKTLYHLHYNSGEITKCTTYFYRNLTEPPYTVISNEAKDFYLLRIFSTGNHMVKIYIHNPTEILNLPESDFFIVYTNSSSEIAVVSYKIITQLLPSPYYTDCLTYKDTFLGRMGCIYDCRLRQSKAACDCWSTEVPAHFNSPLPFRRHSKVCPPTERFECSQNKICPRQCDNLWYTTDTVWNHMKNEQTNYTKFFIRRPLGVEFVYRIQPYLATVEYLCYVASCIGIWFGISFADIIIIIIKLTEKQVKQQQEPVVPSFGPKMNYQQNRRINKKTNYKSRLTSKFNHFY